jgi:hypothetical protein
LRNGADFCSFLLSKMYAYQFAITWQLIKMENGDEVVARSVSGTCPRQNDSLLEIRIRGKLRGYEFL